MAPRRNIKACLFDIGGVCVRSPMLAIQEYETHLSLPAGYINYAIVKSAPSGAWHKLERGEMPMNSTFFRAFSSDLMRESTWRSFHTAVSAAESSSPCPSIDGEALFWAMMRKSREFDPVVIGAIRRLRETGRYKLAALTNDYQYPAGHPYADNSALRALFDVFVSSSETGMRKPEHGFYRLALERLGLADEPGSAVFLDDIGMNLKAAAEVGLITIKVPLEQSWKAIKQLEEITDEKLLDEESAKITQAGFSKL